MILTLLFIWSMNPTTGAGTVTVTTHASYEQCLAHVEARRITGMTNCVEARSPESFDSMGSALAVNGCTLARQTDDVQTWACKGHIYGARS